MSDSKEKNGESSEIKNNPKIKLLKKNARKRSLLENLESDYSVQDLDELLKNEVVDEEILIEDKNLLHLKGKYERFWLDRPKNIIHKEIVVIQPNGKVIIKAPKSIYNGVARYLLNSLLQINIDTLNDEHDIALTILAYVGRHEFHDISCLHSYSLSASFDNSPVVNYEILVPITHSDTLNVPQIIGIDSTEFSKLKFRYPELYNCLKRVNAVPPSKVEWV